MEVTGRHANEVSLKKTNMNEHHFYPRQRHHEQHYADHDQHHHNTWARCSTTHLMMKHPPWFVDGNKWCDNKVETHDVHCALKPLHGSQRRTHIVRSESKTAWMRITQMPCDQTHNHAWCVAHQISLRTQQTDRRKCGKRMTVDEVHFE